MHQWHVYIDGPKGSAYEVCPTFHPLSIDTAGTTSLPTSPISHLYGNVS